MVGVCDVVRVCRSCVWLVCVVGVCGGVFVHSQLKFKIRQLKEFHFYTFFTKIVGPENLKDQGLNKDYKQFLFEG